MVAEDVAVAAVDRDTTAASTAAVLRTTWRVSGAVGVGIDLCPYAHLERFARAWRGRAERIFSGLERRAFGDRLAIPWAAREAVLKALGLRSVLGAPLAEMTVARDGEDDRLVYAPTGVARATLESRGLHIELRTWIEEDAALVVAVASDDGDRRSAVSLRVVPDEGRPSESARRAAEAALRSIGGDLLIPEGGESWGGGGSEAPRWLGRPAALVSLSHDGGRSAAVVVTAAGGVA